MLGIYDYTVVLTYISLMVSLGGIMFAVNGHVCIGVMCLAVSGLCDMFDGKIARTKKNRTEDEKRFGIQIDSLCDILCYLLGMKSPIGIIILLFYVLTGLIRLAWFNVVEEHRQEETSKKRECYQGLPITSMAIVLPILVMLAPSIGGAFIIILHISVLMVGLLFITNFELRKPGNKMMAAIVLVVAAAVIWMLRCKYHSMV